MDITTFKQQVAGYTGRQVEYFTLNEDGSAGPDKLLISINNAKLFLQRQVDFEYCRVSADLVYTPVVGTNVDTAVLHGTETVIKVKKVDNVYASTGFAQLKPLRMANRKAVAKLARGGLDNGSWSGDPCSLGSSVLGVNSNDPIVITQGKILYLYPDYVATTAAPTFSLVIDCIRLLEDYAPPNGDDPEADGYLPGNPTDFLLDYCQDYLLFRSLAELNVFMKDEEQISVSQSKMQEALNSVREWNADLDASGFDLT